MTDTFDQGVLSFPVTPFRDEGAFGVVDLDVFAQHLEQQLEHHPAALFVGMRDR